MPSALAYEPTNKEYRDASNAELVAMRKAHNTAWEYWRGQHPKYLKMNGNIEDNIILNIAQQSIERTLSFLLPEFPHISIAEEGNTDLEEAIWEVWKANKGTVLLYGMALNGCLDGHGYARVQLDKRGNIRIYNLDASRVVTFWDNDDIDNVLWYEVHWKTGKVAYRQDTVHEGDIWR